MEIFEKKSSWIERLYASNPEMISFYPIDITNFLFKIGSKNSPGTSLGSFSFDKSIGIRSDR